MFLKKQAQLHPDKQTCQLQRLSDTRWASRYFAVDAICCTYDCVIATLEAIADGDDKCKAKEAKGILFQVRSFKFLLLLIIFSRILSFTKRLSDQLQSVSNDMAGAADLVEATIETLEDIRSDNSWNHLYTYTEDVAKLNNADLLSIATGRPFCSKQLPKRLKSGIVLQSTRSREPVSTSEEFKVSLYFSILDSMLGELKHRFDKKNLEIMKAIQLCNPQSAAFLNYEKLCPLALQYGLDVDLLEVECHLAKYTFKDKDMESVSDCLKEVSALDAAFPTLKKLMQIALTVVVSTTSCEHSFSSLKRVKSYLHSTMSEERLVDLVTLSTEKDLARSICLDKVVDEFICPTKKEKLCYHKYYVVVI